MPCRLTRCGGRSFLRAFAREKKKITKITKTKTKRCAQNDRERTRKIPVGCRARAVRGEEKKCEKVQRSADGESYCTRKARYEKIKTEHKHTFMQCVLFVLISTHVDGTYLVEWRRRLVRMSYLRALRVYVYIL